MSDADEFMERRQARGNAVPISGKAFGLLITLLAMAIGGLVKSVWDQHSAATRFELQIASIVERLGQETRDSAAARARNEARISSLERATSEHERQQERMIGEWGSQLRYHEKRIERIEHRCEQLRKFKEMDN